MVGKSWHGGHDGFKGDHHTIPVESHIVSCDIDWAVGMGNLQLTKHQWTAYDRPQRMGRVPALWSLAPRILGARWIVQAPVVACEGSTPSDMISLETLREIEGGHRGEVLSVPTEAF